MTEDLMNLDIWLARVQKAGSAKDVYKILDEFRPLTWTHDERSRMAKAYVRVLERVGVQAGEETVVDEEIKNDGPVWYEKM